MTDSSTRAYNGSIVSNETADKASGNRSPEDYDPSYNLSRFLADKDQNPPAGHATAQSPEEAEKRMQEVLRTFDAQFSSNSDNPRGS
ncbi:hypothetical protein V8C35DRAFT_282355 [Trichoderma chlorosporum]